MQKLSKGDEYYIPKNIPHAGKFIAGTRTIHYFGGKRAERAQTVTSSDNEGPAAHGAG